MLLFMPYSHLPDWGGSLPISIPASVLLLTRDTHLCQIQINCVGWHYQHTELFLSVKTDAAPSAVAGVQLMEILTNQTGTKNNFMELHRRAEASVQLTNQNIRYLIPTNRFIVCKLQVIDTKFRLQETFKPPSGSGWQINYCSLANYVALDGNKVQFKTVTATAVLR